MAKVLFGAGTIDQRNKIAGWVYSKNRYGGYIRKKVTPVNPQTAHQQAQRQQLGSLSSQWRGLTQAQREGWIGAAPSFPFIDVFGQQVILAGNALYIALNKNLLNAGQPVISDAPSPVGLDSISIANLAATAGVPSITADVTPAALPTDTALFVYATPNVGPGIGFVKNRYRFIGTATPTTGTIDITAIWQTRFGNLTAGQKLFVKLVLVSTVTGQSGVPVAESAIIGT